MAYPPARVFKHSEGGATQSFEASEVAIGREQIATVFDLGNRDDAGAVKREIAIRSPHLANTELLH